MVMGSHVSCLQWTYRVDSLYVLLQMKYAVMRIICCRLMLTSHIFLQRRCQHMNRKKTDCSYMLSFQPERIQTHLYVILENDSKTYVVLDCLLTGLINNVSNTRHYFTVIFIYYNVYWCQGCGVSTFCQTNIWWWWWWRLISKNGRVA